MTGRILRRVIAVLWVLVIGLAQAVPVHAQSKTTRTVSVSPWTVTLDPNDPTTPEYGCLPEKIFLAGEIRSQVTKTMDATGVVHYTHQLIPNQVTGIGWPSGTRYRAVGMHYHTGEVFHGGPEPVNGPFHLAVKQVFNVIGQGPGTNLLLHLLWRVTVNANGEAHGFIDQLRVQCQ